MHRILEEILLSKYYEILKRKQRGLYYKPFWDRPAFDLKSYLEREKFVIIAEVKRASPLRGSIRKDFDPLKLASQYMRAGAKAISVITEEHFFFGSLEYLAGIRTICPLPLLRKDFILDPVQIDEAKAFGADMVLLIAGILKVEELRELYRYSKRLGLSALVEIHSEEDLEKALDCGAEVIGINNRDLTNLKVDPENSFRMKRKIPKNISVIAESGICEPGEVSRLSKEGFQGVLIGTALVRAEEPYALLRKMVEAVTYAGVPQF